MVRYKISKYQKEQIQATLPMLVQYGIIKFTSIGKRHLEYMEVELDKLNELQLEHLNKILKNK